MTGKENDCTELLMSINGMADALLHCLEARGKEGAVISKDAAITLINMSGNPKVAR